MRDHALMDSSDDETMAVSAPPVVSIGADIDVVRLVDEIRAAVNRKKKAGVYPEDLMTELEVTSDDVTVALEGLRLGAVFSTQPPLGSPRRVVGRPAAVVKRGLRLALRWYSQWMVTQLSTFASAVMATATVLYDRLQQHSRDLRQLQAEVRHHKTWVQMWMIEMDRRLDQLSRARGGDEMAQTPLFERSIDLRMLGRWHSESNTDMLVRRAEYVELFRPAPGAIVDLRADNGEFLELLREAGLNAYGIDTVPETVQGCRDRGLDVRHDDAINHLSSVSTRSLGGIFAAHLVERLDSASILRLFQLAAEKLVDGGTLVLETLNPRTLATHTSSAYADLSRVELIHPDVLTFLARSTGLRDIKVRYPSSNPQKKGGPFHSAAEDVSPLVDQLNERLGRIDDLLFGPTVFAVIARR